ncbi:ankyrin repeat domain-containing protein [Raineya sp.]
MKIITYIFGLSFFLQNVLAQDVCITKLEKDVLQAINNFRAEKGLKALKISKILMLTANKNAETMANQTYTDFKVTQFGNYTGRTQRIKMASSVTSYNQIVNTLISPSEYNKNAKILGNTEEFAQFQWKAIGISLRKSNDASVPTVICVYVGESEEEIINPKECSQDEIYFSQNIKPQADRVEVVKPQEKDWRYVKIKLIGEREFDIVSWYLYGFNASGKKKINNDNFSRKKDSIRHAQFGDMPNFTTGSIKINPDDTNYDSYEIYYYPKPSPIVPQEFVFRISRNELKKSPKDIWYNLDYPKGNTLAELKAYLEQNPKNLYLKDEPYKYNVLHRAVMQDNLECVAYLLNEKKVDVNLPADFGVVPMALCRSEAMFDLLMTKKPNLNLVDNTNTTILHTLASYGVLKGVKYMVEVQKANLNAMDRQKGTPLYHATKNSHDEVVRYLVSKGAKQTMGWGKYPIQVAIENVDIPLVKFFIENGGKAHLDLPDESGFYPLWLALIKKNMELIRLVIENGANLEQKMEDGQGRMVRIVDFYNNDIDRSPEVIEYLKSKGVKFIP